jgi:hypothetical protein
MAYNKGWKNTGYEPEYQKGEATEEVVPIFETSFFWIPT